MQSITSITYPDTKYVNFTISRNSVIKSLIMVRITISKKWQNLIKFQSFYNLLVAKIIQKSLNLFGLVNFWLTFWKEKRNFFVNSSPVFNLASTKNSGKVVEYTTPCNIILSERNAWIRGAKKWRGGGKFECTAVEGEGTKFECKEFGTAHHIYWQKLTNFCG